MRYVLNHHKIMTAGIQIIGMLLFTMGLSILVIDLGHLMNMQLNFQKLDTEVSQEIINYYLILLLSLFLTIIFFNKIKGVAAFGYSFACAWLLLKLDIFNFLDKLILSPEQAETFNVAEILKILGFQVFVSIPIILILFVFLAFRVYKKEIKEVSIMLVIAITTILVHDISLFIIERNIASQLLEKSKENVVQYLQKNGQQSLCEISGIYCFIKLDKNYKYILNKDENFQIRTKLETYLNVNPDSNKMVKVNGENIAYYKLHELRVFVAKLYIYDFSNIYYQLGILINLIGLSLLYFVRKNKWK